MLRALLDSFLSPAKYHKIVCVSNKYIYVYSIKSSGVSSKSSAIQEIELLNAPKYDFFKLLSLSYINSSRTVMMTF